jgi:tight adherence protein B
MHLQASLAFASAAALGTVQLAAKLRERRTEHRMREIAGLVAHRADGGGSIRTPVPHPLRDRRSNKRSAELSSQLAPALELIVGHLRIGRNVSAAIAEVVDSIDDPLRSIFVEALEEARLGTPLSDSLQRLSVNERNRHLGVVASAIGLQAHHGGSLVEVLETVHTTIEEEDRLQRDIRTLTADNRLSARVLLALPPVVLVVVSVLNPGYAAPLITEPLGRQMSAVGAVLALIGWRWLRRLAKPDVVA